ncbi:PucR family transcriptional regulator [Halalkalibacter okhensis]|uniref:PucR family transcriptional regulator n=1 Tax=Halalkalibacter okhensis TaxID=333138 RepID=A0A0B0I7Q1_9BACI|nr:PucR family transcriptional regulator [Halalkalibacter okhensis]KHF38483.1 hypothetical protein LQ50_21015 [Halalkalibacter okhensis]
MQLTMADIMNLDILEAATIRTAVNCLPARIVEWISITEAPVENFVRKNELVLTTGIGCENDMVLFEEFVHDVINSGASALAIATGRFIFDIPHTLLEFAEASNFPLIELPWELRFADISHEVMNELTRKQQMDLNESKQIQEQLLGLILDGQDLADVATFVSKKINQPIVITDKHTSIRGVYPKSSQITKLWEELSSEKVIPLNNDNESSFSQDPLQMKMQVESYKGQNLIQLPIIKGYNRIQGYLYVLPRSSLQSVDHLLDRYVNSVLEHAVTTSALWFFRENVIEETELRLRNDFVKRLALEPIEVWERVIERGELLGYKMDVPYVCIIGDLDHIESYYKKSQNNKSSFAEWFQSVLHYIDEELIHSAQSMQKQIMITHKHDEVIIFLETDSDSSSESVNNFLDLLDRRLTNLLPELGILWGIGRYHDPPYLFQKSYREAKLSINIGKKKDLLSPRIHFNDTAFERAILSLMNSEDMIDVVSSTIVPILQYDENRETDLIKTFNVFYDNQCNVSKTARALNLHRQSLLYRLRKIEALTGLSLVNSDHLFLLTLSLKVWSIGLANEIKQ